MKIAGIKLPKRESIENDKDLEFGADLMSFYAYNIKNVKH